MTWKAALVLGLLLARPAVAEEVTLEMPNRLAALADFQSGSAAKPAILILHGFLQTHDFHTVHSMEEGLHDEGYTVLAPTLTLGIPYRGQSMACEAFHTHTLKQDEAEIGAWVKWLEAKQKGPIILVGHSTGSMELLTYLSHHRNPRIRKFIGASIIEATLQDGEAGREKLIDSLKRRIRAKDNSPVVHQFSFCSQYTATPESLLSYIRWSPSMIVDTSRRLNLPVTFLMGSDDKRVPPDWIAQLRKTGKKVRLIEGAGHFLDGTHEFDLLDALSEEARL
jgi:pimeloyl-ACP methyl ester carboxylesterase